MADVSAGDDAEVTSDGSGVGLEGIGGTQKESASGNHTSAFPDHADDGARKHVLDEGWEETFVGEISIMFLEEFFRRGHLFEGQEEVSSFFEAGNDLANESPLNAIRLDHDKGSFHC